MEIQLENKATWREPRNTELEDPVFNAIWNLIKRWDVRYKDDDVMRTATLGNHVCLIIDTIRISGGLTAMPNNALAPDAKGRAGEARSLYETELCMTRKQFDKIMGGDSDLGSVDDDNAFLGLQIIRNISRNLVLRVQIMM